MSSDLLTIASTSLDVRRALDWIASQISSSPFDHRRDDITLAASEVLNNIVRHGYAEAVNGRIDLEIRQTDTGLTLVITDTAPLSLPEAIESETHDFPKIEDIPRDELPESGFGLALIYACADGVTFERLVDRNVTVLEFLS
ncbi:MAG: hypothetical protein H6R00_799 [Proteobacteria bacterium]|nr:hypothetical protein [Pseudomonadota bacterium]